MKRDRAITLLKSGVEDMNLPPIPRRFFDVLSARPTTKEVMGAMIDVVLLLGGKDDFTLERAKSFLARCLLADKPAEVEGDQKRNGRKDARTNDPRYDTGSSQRVISVVRRLG